MNKQAINLQSWMHGARYTINWIGSRPISLDIRLMLLVFGSSFELTQIQHRFIQYPVILDSYPSNKIYIYGHLTTFTPELQMQPQYKVQIAHNVIYDIIQLLPVTGLQSSYLTSCMQP